MVFRLCAAVYVCALCKLSRAIVLVCLCFISVLISCIILCMIFILFCLLFTIFEKLIEIMWATVKRGPHRIVRQTEIYFIHTQFRTIQHIHIYTIMCHI